MADEASARGETLIPNVYSITDSHVRDAMRERFHDQTNNNSTTFGARDPAGNAHASVSESASADERKTFIVSFHDVRHGSLQLSGR